MIAAWVCLGALGAQPVQLDLGPYSGPVLAGFHRLSPEGSDDTRARWSQVPAAARWVGEPDPVAGDGISGGVLHLDLEPGPWVAWLMLGQARIPGRYDMPVAPGSRLEVTVDGVEAWADQVPTGPAFLRSRWYAANPVPRFVHGQTEWHRQVLPVTGWTRVALEVGEHGVDLAVRGTALRGLIAVPRDREIEGEVMVDAADLTRQAWFEAHAAPESMLRQPPGPGEGPLRVQVADWLDLPDPERASPAPEVRWTGCPGERLTTVLWLFGDDAPATWEIDAPPGWAVSGAEVLYSDQRLHYERFRQARPTWLVASDGAIAAGHGVPAGLALVLTLPDDVRPGTAVGVVRLRRAGQTLELPFEVRIRDLHLDPAPVPVGFFADVRPPLTLATGHGSAEVLATLDEDLDRMRALGFDALGVRYASPWPRKWEPGARPDTALFEGVARRWRARGGRALLWVDPYLFLVPAYRSPRVQGLPERLQAVVAELVRVATSVGATAYIYDEDGGSDVRNADQLPLVARAVRDLGPPDTHLAGALPATVDWPVATALDVAYVTLRPAPSLERVNLVRATGASTWAYNLTPERSAGLLTWALRYDGLLQWHWNDTQGDPFDDVHRRPQFQYTALAPDGRIWSSTLLESFAAGVVDLRYLATLERLVARREGARSRRKRRQAVRGRALLDAARTAADGADPIGVHAGTAFPQAGLANLRRAVGDEAERLSRRARRPPEPAGSGTAAPLSVEVLGSPERRWPKPWLERVPSPVPSARGPIRAVDGVLDDPVWRDAPVAPGLEAWASGPAPPEVHLRVGLTPEGLALAIDGLTDEMDATVLVDPDGAWQRWLVAEVGPAGVTWQRCGFAGLPLVVEERLRSGAAPCIPLQGGAWAAVGGTVEIGLPWAVLGPTTDGLSLTWNLRVPGGAGGTWSPSRSGSLAPEQALRIETGGSHATLRVGTDATANRWRGRLLDADPTGWTWTLWRRGAAIGTGPIDPDGQFEVLGVDLADGVFTATAPGSEPLRQAATARARALVATASVTTPAFSEAVELSFFLANPVNAAPVVVRDARGAVLAETTVDLPGGRGAVRVAADPSWPEVIRVELGDWTVGGLSVRADPP